MSEQDFFWALVLLGGMVVVILATVAFSRRQARLRRRQKNANVDARAGRGSVAGA